MQKTISPKSIAITFGVLVTVFLAAFYAVAWTEPSQNPPAANVAPPLNEGVAGQSKAGGLILNTGGAANGLIVDKGNVGIGTANPSQKLDVVGYVKGSTGLCIGSDCRISWPGGDGGGGGWTEDATNNKVYVTTIGRNVGIGTTNPGAKLEVVGSMNLKGGVISGFTSGNSEGLRIWADSTTGGNLNMFPPGQPSSPNNVLIRYNPSVLKSEICLNSDCRNAWPAGGGGGGGSGTVTSVGSGAGLTGGPITTSGTLSVKNISFACNNSNESLKSLNIDTGVTTCEIDDTGAGGGAPTGASYVVVGLDGSLTNERRLVAGSGISITDGGANGDVTIAATGGGGGVSGSGVTGYIPKWNGATSLINSQIIDTGTNLYLGNNNVGIGVTTPNFKLDVNGDIHATWLYLGAGGSEGSIRNVNEIAGTNDLFLKGNTGGTAPVYLDGNEIKAYTGGQERLKIDSVGNITVGGNVTVGGSVTAGSASVTGNVTVGGAIDIGWERVTSPSSPDNVEQWSVDCSPGKILLGGGCYLYEQNAELNGSHPSISFPNSTWVCDALGETTQIIAYAICANVVPH